MRGSSTLLALSLVAPGAPAGVSELEREAGWIDLFDGRSLAGWHTIGESGVRADGWEIADGCLHLPAGATGGDLVTDTTYGDFELELEWKVAPGTNSGIKYRVAETPGASAMLGPEYQVLDDAAQPSTEPPQLLAASLYALYEPSAKQLAPLGSFNHTRIVARGTRIEHWLNGLRVLECDVGSADWETRRKASKFAPHADFARGRGRIGLQDHGGEVWFRNLRVRDLENLPGEPVELFDGTSLTGWKALGDARYSVDDGCILGEVGEGGHSFLVSERTFGDFLFEVDVKTELPGNSGIQIRSHVNDEQRVVGYQVEIDPTERAWSGGIYDEGRRGQFLDDKLAGGRAFVPGEWNHYRIECLGPWIRTWINGVPAADVLDPLDLEGFIGLQVHSGHDTRVRWRNFRLRDLGTRQWELLTSGETNAIWWMSNLRTRIANTDSVQIRCEVKLGSDLSGLRLRFCQVPHAPSNPDLPRLGVSNGLKLYRLKEAWAAHGADPLDFEVLLSSDRIRITSRGRPVPSNDSENTGRPSTLNLVHGGDLQLEQIERIGPPIPQDPATRLRRD